MRRRLLDSDTVSYYLGGHQKVMERARKYLMTFGSLDFSIITYYEVRRGLVYAGATRKLGDFEALAILSNVWLLDRKEACEAADIWTELRRQGMPLGDADILIAGIARANGLVLDTNNVQHFSRILGL